MTTPKQTYALTDAQRIGFASIFVLDKMARKGRQFAVVPTDPDEMALKDVIQTLFNEHLIEIQGAHYALTEAGKERVRRFRQRYEEYLTVYDIYCAVDLATGEFAFERYYDFDDDGWRLYLQQDRWEDLRVAVAIYKKLDPVEIVFMSFVMEGRFDDYADGKWELGVLSGELWQEILDIVNTNLHPCQLGYTTTDPNNPGQTLEVTPDDVLTDMVTRGSQIMLELVRRGQEIEAEQRALEAATPTTPTTATTTTTETVYDYDFVITNPYVYYTPYLSPYYVSPVWTVPLYPTVVVF
ncbi:MAG: hypothetical protein SNJ67_08910 [Chloracidobacterium sp.]|uniref:Uncharacterized protein n=1 Tax=Chloracidobacterium validum TaxID=2821543 RepID=A0ABX8B6S9_9BACT|nr:hypothetical protein [Chloracidobacterium validum]QUW02341.1 hypothetical protein J8C06_08225 [Chloracidobacterium validum]